MKRIVIIGASGHAKVVAEIAKLNGYKDFIFFADVDIGVKECAGYPVLIGKSTEVPDAQEMFVAIGNDEARKRFMDQYKERNFPVLIHPNAVVAHGVEIGEGSVIMAGAVINPSSRIGRGAIVNTTSSVDHDCVLGDYVQVAPGAHLCGTVIVGDGTFIGAGATVRDKVKICGGCIIGAGAVVIGDLHEPGTYIGVPARKRSSV